METDQSSQAAQVTDSPWQQKRPAAIDRTGIAKKIAGISPVPDPESNGTSRSQSFSGSFEDFPNSRV